MTLHIKTAQIPRQPTLCLQGHLLQPKSWQNKREQNPSYTLPQHLQTESGSIACQPRANGIYGH